MLRNSTGFTLLELLIVMTVVTLIAVLTIALLPGVSKRSEEMTCISNLREIHVAFQMYLQDHQMRLPWRYQPEKKPPVSYKDDLAPYMNGSLEAFICPSHEAIDFPAQASYGINYHYDHAVTLRVDKPSQTILLAETAGRFGTGSHRAQRDSENPGQLASERHRGSSHFLFFDGSVRAMKHKDSVSPVDYWGENLREDNPGA